MFAPFLGWAIKKKKLFLPCLSTVGQKLDPACKMKQLLEKRKRKSEKSEMKKKLQK